MGSKPASFLLIVLKRCYRNKQSTEQPALHPQRPHTITQIYDVINMNSSSRVVQIYT